ncbi:MAG TPA: redox-regulated ATPase YchF [Anaerolineae bacterium]|nr:redox-regulated ATPase YchF [Anaerolineae bacterium]
MKLGVIGLPGAGKTTIFNALTQGNVPPGQSVGGRFDVLTAVVPVPDARVDKLTEMFNPKKTTYARVTYSDVSGLQRKDSDKMGLTGPLLNHLGGLDGFIHVVRAFESDLAPHPAGSVDALRDLESLDMEFLLNDLVAVERRVEKLQDGLRKGASKNKGADMAELELMERLQEALSEETPLRDLGLTDEEEKSLRSYAFMTLKPVLVIFNIGDDQDEIEIDYDHQLSRVANLRGKLEMELNQLAGPDGDPESLEMFMEEYGVEELGLDRAIRLSYDLMGLHSFFTVGEDEVRAWTIPVGADAVQAAGAIHTDLAKGFIRAEVVAYQDLIELGGLSAAKSAGKFRQEGKTYIVEDGDVINIKFNL